MAIDWGAVWTEIGKAAVIAGLIIWGAKAVFKHFLTIDLANYKDKLKHESDLALAAAQNQLKHASDLALEQRRNELNRQTQGALAAQKAELDRIAMIFKEELIQATSREERIRQEVERWANPILDAVRSLQGRLTNVFK
jgi:hypothetical protein